MIIIIAFLIKLAFAQDDATLPFDKYCEFHKYPVETHEVTTLDGYNLKVFRTQSKYSKISEGLPVVFLMHGLLSSSDCYIVNDESMAPAFMLANAGFDVWAGNVRGNKYSRSHSTLNPDKDEKFWDFSWQEMSEYDLPSMIDFIHKETGKKINYIGHSQGTLIMFASLANSTALSDKIESFTALGPALFIDNAKSNIMNMLDNKMLFSALSSFGLYEFMPTSSVETYFGHIFCRFFSSICVDLVGWLTDFNPSLDNKDRYNYLAGHDPSGTSLRNIKHFMQMKNNHENKLFKYDFGEKENIEKYGQSTPPTYNLNNIKLPKINIFRGESDRLVTMEDSQRLIDLLKVTNPNLQDNVESLGHISFFIGSDMSFMRKLIEDLKSYPVSIENEKKFLE